ncbi:MAG TPA: SseB family protein [Lacisediminihabitans sp.]|uniref:SseB family protein n=1 Tax=Lacisediminihabitans sp. TaxID=2787631 RepID=UPI002EDB2825
METVLGAVRDPTELERMIVLAQAGRASSFDVLTTFASTPVVVPSGTVVTDNLSQLQPLLFDRDGITMVAIFTHLDEIADFAELARYTLTTLGRNLLISLPPTAGIVVNPSRSIGFDVLPDGIGAFLRDSRE